IKQAPDEASKADAFASTALASSAAESPWLEVRSVAVEPVGSGRRVTIALSRAPEGVQDLGMSTPPRLVIDFAGPRPDAPMAITPFPVSDDLVSQVRIGTHRGSLRAVIDLSRAPGVHAVRQEGNNVIADLGVTVPADTAARAEDGAPSSAPAPQVE